MSYFNLFFISLSFVLNTESCRRQDNAIFVVVQYSCFNWFFHFYHFFQRIEWIIGDRLMKLVLFCSIPFSFFSFLHRIEWVTGDRIMKLVLFCSIPFFIFLIFSQNRVSYRRQDNEIGSVLQYTFFHFSNFFTE